MYNDKVRVLFEDELNRFIRTEVTENPHLYFFLLRPFDNFFLKITSPFFIIGEVKCNKLLKTIWEGQVCVLLNTQISSFATCHDGYLICFNESGDSVKAELRIVFVILYVPGPPLKSKVVQVA